MQYEELNYRQMMQVVVACRTCRLAVCDNGQPYVVPLCVQCRQCSGVPIFTLTSRADGRLRACLRENPAVMLEFEHTCFGNETESVLVSGMACCNAAMQKEAPFARGGVSDGSAWQRPFGRQEFSRFEPPLQSDWEEPAFNAQESGRMCTRCGSKKCSCYAAQTPRMGRDFGDNAACCGGDTFPCFGRQKNTEQAFFDAENTEPYRKPFDFRAEESGELYITVRTREMTGRVYSVDTACHME